MSKQKLFVRAVLCTLPVFLFSCETDPEVTESDILEYNNIAYPTSDLPVLEKIDCYIDYSYGVAGGIRTNATFINDLKTIIDGNATYYRVGAQDVPPQIDIKAIENNPATENPQKDPGSKLGVAMGKIIKNKNKTSVFITDFERIENKDEVRSTINSPGKHPIDVDAWGKEYFKEWLKEGNRIDVFARKFTKLDLVFDSKNSNQQYENWIYTIVFTPKSIINDKGSYNTSVVKRLLDKYPNYGNGVDTRHYSYSINNFEIKSNQTEGVGNVNENLVNTNYYPVTSRSEYYEFLDGDIQSFLSDPNLNDKRILNKLTIQNTLPSLQGVDYGLKVYDVTGSYTDFLLYKEQSGELPEYKTNPETGEKTIIKPGAQPFKFTKGQEVEDIFTSVYNTKTKVLGLKMHDNYTGVDDPMFFQVDVVLKSAKPKFTDEDKVFVLNYKNGFQIKSMYESIAAAMTEATTNAQNNTLYTFFIKINP